MIDKVDKKMSAVTLRSRNKLPDGVDEIISGGADGIDTLAEQYADSHKISKHIIRPQYSKYGKAAPIARNKKMVELADEVLVIWDGRSKGSLSAVKYAKGMNKNVNVITYEKTEN